ncbi:MAG: Ni/Fe hydrogenase subunit gamma [Candidatus Fraserbacteria bacterium RBG_16_55_9]|uniref:Ni/Fe hydrogenase subunit gamma n=1 Tax=Fraserbacteria sp. (strain RBG_16_55_9) TaxID=1817864 RepID=A0A1F5UYW0_FRAXR|nr:MAG: Ni/Fe hydrogenase subunit gamma [Candidatus Fraserbacteria bacterium RBG_16_55_9]
MVLTLMPKMIATADGIDPMLPRPYRVQRVRRETYDTFTLELEPLRDAVEFSFAPGQFNMLYRFGVGEVPISISGDPGQPKTLIHTVRAVGATTKAICKMKRGQILGVRGPFGSPWPMEESTGNDVMIVAGGIGLAPLRPAIYHLLAHRGQYGRIALLYGARTPKDLLYTRELEQWRGRFDLQVEVTVDSAKPEEWRGPVGVVTALIPRAAFDPLHTTALVVGPEIMMRFTVLELQKCDVRDDQIVLSMERNMKCAIGFCGHCQYGPTFICKDGPVFRYDCIKELFGKREI